MNFVLKYLTNPCCPDEPIEAEVLATVAAVVREDGYIDCSGHVRIIDNQREALYCACGASLELRERDGTYYLAKN